LPDAVESIAAIVGLGVDIGWGIHIGGGFEALAALAGTVLVSVDASGQLGAVVQDTLVANYAPIAGGSVEIPGGYRVGLTFRGALEGRFDVRIDVKDLGQITVPPIFVSGLAQYDPLTLESEFARVVGPIRGSVAIGYRRWSSYPGLAEPTVRCPINLETLEIPICGAIKAKESGFNDTVIARASVEYTMVPRTGIEIDLRGGYAFESAAGPEQTGEENLFVEARSVFGIGVGTALVEPIVRGIHVDTFAQFGVVHGRTHVKDAGVRPNNAGFPEVETGGTMFTAGATAGVAF
jgi:long-chain fatty acid transport protein